MAFHLKDRPIETQTGIELNVFEDYDWEERQRSWGAVLQIDCSVYPIHPFGDVFPKWIESSLANWTIAPIKQWLRIYSEYTLNIPFEWHMSGNKRSVSYESDISCLFSIQSNG